MNEEINEVWRFFICIILGIILGQSCSARSNTEEILKRLNNVKVCTQVESE